MICSSVALTVYVITLVGLVSAMFQTIPAGSQPTFQQMQSAQQAILQKHAPLIILQVAAMALAGVGLVLGIVALVIHRRGNWAAVTSVTVGGLFFFCICSAFVVTLIMSSTG
jgi:hypothetical protein